MKRTHLLITFYILHLTLFAQTIHQKLQTAYLQFQSDSQLKHAAISLYIINAKTGEVVFDKNSELGLAPASTQKIITASTAFELLGKDYRYKTEFGYAGQPDNGLLVGDLFFLGSGDPTLGSWRYGSTKREVIDNDFVNALRQQKIATLRGGLTGVTKNFETQKIPGGWIWEDIGNYYGAGCGGLNWNENQFDLVLRPGKEINDPVKILKTTPPLTNDFLNELKTGDKESGDNGYIYFFPGSSEYAVRGTEPCCVDSFTISGAAPDNDYFTLNHFAGVLLLNKIINDHSDVHIAINPTFTNDPKIFYTHYSPPLDSIIYWFLQKSINLYGEALIKTLSKEKTGFGATDTGVGVIKDFWKEKGIDPDELNIKDGSGLYPQNRVTTHAQVGILKYAKGQSWFPYFYNALPEYNNMKMKSGSISDVKGFCGYHTAGNGTQYIFSFLVNNYSGRSSSVVEKMYKVLNILK